MEVLPPIISKAHIYAAPQRLVMTSTLRCGAMGRFWPYRSGAMNDPASELRRTPLLGCEYPGGWLWATPRSGLTLLLRGPEGCLASDSSAEHPGVARRPPGAGAAS